MASPDRIFRQAALDKLSSPEQLDQLMQVTTPKSWMALMAFGALLLTALFWGIFGRIDTQVHGRGIFLRSEGVSLVTARAEGNVLELRIQHGDRVTSNQLLARISQPELEIKLRQAVTNYEGIEASLRDLRRSQTNEQALEAEEWDTQRLMLDRMITNYAAQIAALKARTNVQSELYGKGLVSQSQYLDTQNALFAAQHDFHRTQVQLQQVRLALFQGEGRRRQLTSERADQLQQAQHQVEYLSNLYALNTEVHSPQDGQILEVMVKQGDLIPANTPVASLQGATNELEARLYLSAADGKLLASKFQSRPRKSPSESDPASAALKPMEALLAPVSVKKEKFGLMRGVVKDASDISEYPVTPQGMLRVLQNPALVAEFSQAGPPIEVTVHLEKTASTESGYVWTSTRGPDMQITSGTPCEGKITIDRNAPITLLLPHLGKETRR